MNEFLNWPGWNAITIIACAVGWIAAALFIVKYQRTSGGDWRRNPFGRYLMTRKLAVLGLFSVVLINRFFPEWDWRLMITAFLMCAFALQTFVPYRLLVEAQQERAHNEEARQ